MDETPSLVEFDGHRPAAAADVYIAPSARVIGRVRLEAGVSVWPGAVLRADDEAIRIGAGSAVLDLCLLEAPAGHPVDVGEGALISHQACLHGARVGEGALVGIGAIVLDGAVVGSGSLVGAGALVPPGGRIPSGVLAVGQPARVVRPLEAAERTEIRRQLEDLARKAAVYRRGARGPGRAR